MQEKVLENVGRKKKVFENFKSRRVKRVRERLPKAKYSIREVVKMADEAGLSYGHFVAMMYRQGITL